MLGYNRLTHLETNALLNLNSLDALYLNNNLFSSIVNSIKANLRHLTGLSSLDLSRNVIEFIGANDFEYNLGIASINLNSNPIKYIHHSAFQPLIALNTFKVANTYLTCVNLSMLRKNQNIITLDLSSTEIVFDLVTLKMEHLERLHLENVTFRDSNQSFGLFMTDNLKEIDFLE